VVETLRSSGAKEQFITIPKHMKKMQSDKILAFTCVTSVTLLPGFFFTSRLSAWILMA
jgi:hypothetical protein